MFACYKDDNRLLVCQHSVMFMSSRSEGFQEHSRDRQTLSTRQSCHVHSSYSKSIVHLNRLRGNKMFLCIGIHLKHKKNSPTGRVKVGSCFCTFPSSLLVYNYQSHSPQFPLLKTTDSQTALWKVHRVQSGVRGGDFI